MRRARVRPGTAQRLATSADRRHRIRHAIHAGQTGRAGRRSRGFPVRCRMRCRRLKIASLLASGQASPHGSQRARRRAASGLRSGRVRGQAMSSDPVFRLQSTVAGNVFMGGRGDVAATLSALSAGQHPNLAGATGRLEFEPQLYTDLASSKLAHWVQRGGQQKAR